MFTGIIETVGTVTQITFQDDKARMRVDTNPQFTAFEMGESIAVNGVCLTVIELPADGFAADVSRETLSLTSLGGLKSGSRVNLEKALTLATPLGGHLVSGHVDGLGEVLERRDDARSVRFRIQAPAELARYIAHKGSICVDGTSLTVNAVEGRSFELNIVPHTLQETIMRDYRAGTRVNLEVDLIARYLERLLLGERAADPGAPGITEALLAEHGFIKP